MENIIVIFLCKQTSTNEVIAFYTTTVKNYCSLGLARWFDENKYLVNSHKFFRISVSRYEKHLWKISLRKSLVRKKLSQCHFNDAYTRQFAPGTFERMTRIRVNPYRRC